MKMVDGRVVELKLYSFGLGPCALPAETYSFFSLLRTWIDASRRQLRPRKVSHRSEQCGGVGGELKASIDACQKLLQTTFPGDTLSTDSRGMILPVLFPNSIHVRMAISHITSTRRSSIF